MSEQIEKIKFLSALEVPSMSINSDPGEDVGCARNLCFDQTSASLSIVTMSEQKTISESYIKLNGSWVKGKTIFIKKDDVWTEIGSEQLAVAAL